MKRKEKYNKTQKKIIIKLAICFIFTMLAFLGIQEKTGCSIVMAAENQKDRMYLSDISYQKEESFAASGHSIKLDKNDGDQLLTLKVKGESKVFLKGLCAWASSQMVYDLSNYQYDYFTAYLGVDIGEQSNYFNTGVRFFVYTSNDGTKWEQKAETPVLYGWSDAQFVQVNIKGAKYLKLVADNNSKDWWAEWYDEAIYADAKLIKEGYVEDITSKVDFIKTVAEYDEIIKKNEGKEISGEYELALLQRELVKNVDYEILQAFVRYDENNKETVKWLMTDVNNLRLYILGGKPDGNYISSLQVLTKLYTAHKDDLDNKALTKHGTVYGELYRKMMITISLTHSAQVALWMDTTSPENQSDPVTRYEIYKKLHADGKFVVSDRQDHTPWFEDLKVEEMRYVFNNIIDDEEIVWLNEYTQKYIDANPKKEEEYLQPHHYMKYIWPDYTRAEFHDETKKEMWDEKYDFLRYGVSFRPGLIKLWMNIEGGAVCGGISKIGSNIRGVHGTPSSVISQPGHAALIYYRKDAQGNGYWTIDNDVSGWAQSGKTEKLSVRMPLGWGSDDYVEGYCASYIVLAQEALNHYEDYEKAEKIIMTAEVYKDNPTKQEEIYRKALEVQPINIDAWYGLIKLYKADETKTQEQYYQLAKEICENLKCFPLPMYQLSNLMKDKMVATEYSFKFTVLQRNTLMEGSTWEDSTQVYQPSITRTMASYLLGNVDTALATFSFDGEDAEKIVLSSRYDNSGINWDYSLDGKKTWNDVTFTADEEHKLTLSKEQISSMTAENDIYVHIVGTSYEDENNIFKIDLTEQENLSNLYNNDLENRVIGVNENTQWRYTEKDNWTSYHTASPDLTGNKTVEIRQAPVGTKLASPSISYTFTEDNQPETRRYVPISHLSIDSVSTEATGNQGNASNSIDGNYNTRWHSAWNGSDTEKYIVIKIDRQIEISALEYVPAGGGNGKILEGKIYGSVDGKTYTEIGNVTWKNDETIKTIEFEERPTVQYIKIEGTKTSSAGGGSFMTARMFNIYQDVTKNPHPTAGIAFSTTKATNQNVIARLVNPSTEITITNPDKKDSYEFKENGEFTFQFYDNVTKKEGTATAKVDWIDKIPPTATIEYRSGTGIDAEVVALLVPSEEVTILNNSSDTYTFEENGEFTFEFQDAAGNKGTATAKVNWIGTGGESLNSPSNPTMPGSPEEIQTNQYKVEEGYISQIKPGTTVSKFKENIEVKNKQNITFVNQHGDMLNEDSIITTETIVKLADNSQFTLEVTGDVDGDGKITINDLVKIKLHLINIEKLTHTKLNASDLDKNDECGLNDLAQLKLVLIGLKEI